MVTLCWAAKGGSGTTVATTLFALESPRPSLLVDLAGETPTVLGLPEPDRPGVADWLRGGGTADQLCDLTVDVDETTVLLPHGLAGGPVGGSTGPTGEPIAPARWAQLVGWLGTWARERAGDVWIDCGTGDPPVEVAGLVGQRLLVTRQCYLSLRRAARSAVRPTGIVAVLEERRALGAKDIEAALGAPIVATLPIDPKISRAVDAGLLITRAPLAVRREIRRLAA